MAWAFGRFRGFQFCRIAAAVITALFIVAHSQSAAANTLNVNTTAMNMVDDGKCSLREALVAAATLSSVNTNDCPAGSGNDVINLPAGTYTSTVRLDIPHTVTIQGSGAAANTVIAANFSGTSYTQLFYVEPFGHLALKKLTLRNDTGSLPQVTGIQVDVGSAEIENARVTQFTRSGLYVVDGVLGVYKSTIDGNSTTNNGGGIYVDSTAESSDAHIGVNYSTISGNTAGNFGGGIYYAGNRNTALHVTTLSGNRAQQGGGLYNATKFVGYLHMTRMTITANTASVSGAGVTENATSSNFFLIYTSIIAGNTVDNNGLNANFVGDAHSEDSVFGKLDGLANITHDGNDLWNVANVKLGPLMPMGGFNELSVHPLLSGSVAIDHDDVTIDPVINPPTYPYDERGLYFQEDGNFDGVARRDAGAYEYNPVWQSEQLGPSAKSSGDTWDVDADAIYSNGMGAQFLANATSDYFTLMIPVAEAGNYAVSVRAKRRPNAGKFRLGTSASVSGTFTELGEQDLYSSTTSSLVLNLGTVTLTAGANYFRFRVSGKNSASTDYDLFFDYLTLQKL